MFSEIFVQTFPGFLSIRNAQHRIVYLNQNFKDWIARFTDIEPLGKTNNEIAERCVPNVADVFCQCHDASLDWQTNCSSNQSLKKTLVFKDAEGIAENTQYFDALKYGLVIDGEPHIFTVCYDVTNMYSELLASYENHANALERIAFVDELTGAPTLSKFTMDIQRALETNPETSYVIVKIDIASFKLINDQFGFQAGDTVIKSLSTAISAILEDEDETFARVNVDEFVIFLRHFTEDDINRRRRTCNEHFMKLVEGMDFSFSMPSGRYIITSYNDVKDDAVSIYEKVNFAHRKAKECNADRFIDYNDDIKNDIVKKQEIESKMVAALKNREFTVFLQPKYTLRSERIGGAEALVRWITPQGMLVTPDAFIPIFEKNGFITKLDLFMLEVVCTQLRAWLDEGLQPPKISVNFSKLHLLKDNFADTISAVCDKHNVPHASLEIELTESIMTHNEECLLAILNSLHEQGFTISMDDFGSGYSSLGLLKNMPMDVLKIDRSFFLSAHDNVRARAVLTNVFNLARDLAMDTVAEGVEEKIHVDMLKKMGCDMVQGYYYGKPMPVAEFEALLRVTR